jgi:hypothetical protein
MSIEISSKRILSKRQRRGTDVYSENPFVKETMITTRRKTVKNTSGERMMIVSQDTGEVKPAGFWTTKEVDDEQFVKLFINGVKAFAELTSAGVKVFEILYQEMQNNPNKDKVYLSYVALIEEGKAVISQATFTRGIKELIEKDFIAASVGVGFYYVNPSFVWNGDRLVIAQEYKRKKKNDTKDTKTIDMFAADS